MNSVFTRIVKKATAKIMNRESGFTLTELAIGMLVVGILASVAVPSFLGARNNAYDKEAQASLIAVLNAADILYANQGDFSDASTAGCGSGAGASTALAADIQKLEPGIDAVAATSSSTNPLTVSVDANTTWSSNSESLGCQAFYATALSRSGNCWIVRKTVEGKFLSSGTTLPIQMATQLNTQNAAVATWTLLQVNGAAFAYIRARSTGADADNTNGLSAIATACKAATQGTGSAGSTANVIKSTEFYTSWKDVQAGANGSNS